MQIAVAVATHRTRRTVSNRRGAGVGVDGGVLNELKFSPTHVLFFRCVVCIPTSWTAIKATIGCVSEWASACVCACIYYIYVCVFVCACVRALNYYTILL